MTNAKGESTNALFGFIRSVLKLIKDFSPTHLVAVWDGPSNIQKREAIYAHYKAHRKAMPPDLLYQIHWALEFCDYMGIPKLIVPGVEADDTMGSVAVWAAQHGVQSFLCTSDKDLCQLVNDKISILNTHKENLLLGPKEVEDQFGVPPHLMVDFLAITGDASDNIPGVAGFGPKTAVELLKQSGSLENLLKFPEKIENKKKQDILIKEGPKALLSQQLVRIDTDVDFPKDPSFFHLKKPQTEFLKKFYADMNFNSLIKELDEENPAEKEKTEYILIEDETTLQKVLKELAKYPEICIDTETTSINPQKAELVGIGLGVNPKQAYYIPLNGKLTENIVLSHIKPFIEQKHSGFFGHNIKYDYQILLNYGIKIGRISFDTILASYLLNAGSRQHSLDTLSLEIFGKIKIPTENLIGKGKKQITMKEVPLEKICEYCCEDVDYTIRLKENLEKKIQQRHLTALLQDLEIPLIPVLATMERHGIYLDVPCLHTLGKHIAQEIHRLEHHIYKLAGAEFNLNSPKQLSEILFTKMGIKPPKKTATGHSTSAEVLEFLQKDYPIAKEILEYRTLEKLRSTYIDILPLEVNPNTHRIHPTFSQSVAATGRLSCQDPNLQNIPIRTEVGKMIREAFRPQKEGWCFLAADYSQIELRLLAHFSEDPELIQAFKNNEDIHRATAANIFNVPLEKVTTEQRYQAKAVNFGVIYGQQAYGLSQELNIDIKEAASFIEKYFEKYPQVKFYIETCKEIARKTGKASTYKGRERIIPEIHSKNIQIRNAAERLAINTPLQGSAADLIKCAMLAIDSRLRETNKKAFMILQIHDELIFEVPNEEVEEIKKIVRQEMENVFSLKIPLIVDITIGKNWKEC